MGRVEAKIVDAEGKPVLVGAGDSVELFLTGDSYDREKRGTHFRKMLGGRGPYDVLKVEQSCLSWLYVKGRDGETQRIHAPNFYKVNSN